MEQEIAAKQVLVLDDDAVFRALVRSLLESQGYDVSEADNGLEGLKSLTTQVPDIVICDIEMPLLDGIEFVEEVSHQYPSLPMIVVSGTDKMSVVAKALKFGIKDFVTKPIVDPSHLLKTVASTLKESQDALLAQRDFSSQWFRLNEQGELPEDQELHWHLDYLHQHPDVSRELLQALLPEPRTREGDWALNFRILQNPNRVPLVFDYAWNINGQFLFYIVDANVAGDLAVSSTLLIRALFNDYIRSQDDQLFHIDNLVANVSKAIQFADCAKPFNAVIGLIDFPSQKLKVHAAGIGCVWSSDQGSIDISPSRLLGASEDKDYVACPMSTSDSNSLKLKSMDGSSCQLIIQNCRA
ncbi:response regulator [Vibrio ishigakensis]|uniref:Response regulator n=2 Tax=Vibrio ishigakensis TaxID=1481914 RepID=A0A0B8NUG4_9VIBR|nr:response regulator [Vibrio ishigakensis]